MATAWDNVPENQATGDQVLGPQPPDLVNKLNIERVELAQKIERLKTFMTLDAKFKEIGYRHQGLLEDQLRGMRIYEQALVERMILLNQQNEN